MNTQINDLKVHVIRRESPPTSFVRESEGDVARYFGVLRIIGDEGLEGNAFVGGLYNDNTRGIVPLVERIKPFLLGKDASDRELLWHQLRKMAHGWDVNAPAVMAVDVALWDLAAKAAGVPVYKMLGAYQHSVQAYSSAPFQTGIETNVDDALACKESGITGYKIHHAVPDLREVVEVCTAIRKAVGDEMALMFDCVFDYGFQEALYVGRALDELNFRWYEDPLGPDDLDSLADLGRRLDMPIAISDAPHFGLNEAPMAIGKAAARILISEPSKDGITGMRKLANLCEAHNLTLNYHHGGNSLLNVANLHVALSVSNGNMFPMLLPVRDFQFGLIEDLEIDPDGCIHAPKRPGLGVEIDWELLDRHTEAVL